MDCVSFPMDVFCFTNDGILGTSIVVYVVVGYYQMFVWIYKCPLKQIKSCAILSHTCSTLLPGRQLRNLFTLSSHLRLGARVIKGRDQQLKLFKYQRDVPRSATL